MGKQGPCYHCGVTSTPLWRNGPPEKPVLCNACGSRWRTKGSLANYTPLHARFDTDDYDDRMARVKTVSLKKSDDKLNKRKLNNENIMDGGFTPDYRQGFQRNFDEDTSNRSSSGSVVSNSESCARFGSVDASELTGPAQSIVWDALVPSRKRTCVTRPKQSSVEKLTKDLCTILHEQASQFSVSSEEELLFENEAPMVSVEIGHGSILIRHPSSIAREEESEASSLSVDNKFCRADEGYSNSSMLMLNDRKRASGSYLGMENAKKLNGQIMQLEQVKRENYDHEKFQSLWNHDSLLRQIDLTDIVNADVFCGQFTDEEQKDLLKYLPTIDTSTVSDSLGSILTSVHFKENLSSYQQLLVDGVFDTSFSGVQAEDCKVVKRLALTDMTKCKWVEHYNMLKVKRSKESTRESLRISEAKYSLSGGVFKGKRPREGHNCLWPELKSATKNGQRMLVKVDCKSNQSLQNEGSCFTPASRSLFNLPMNGSSLFLDSYQFEDESSDQDLLVDVPFNGSFPQAEAELLRPASSFSSQQASVSSNSTHLTHFRT